MYSPAGHGSPSQTKSESYRTAWQLHRRNHYLHTTASGYHLSTSDTHERNHAVCTSAFDFQTTTPHCKHDQRFMALDMSNVEIHPPHNHIKEISIRNPKPRSPNRCRPDNAPVTIRCIIPHTNLSFYFVSSIKHRTSEPDSRTPKMGFEAAIMPYAFHHL